MRAPLTFFFFFFKNPPTPEIYPLPLHDALPILRRARRAALRDSRAFGRAAEPAVCRLGEVPALSRALRGGLHRLTPRRRGFAPTERAGPPRSEEHTSELQSPCNLVCRLLLEKKK